VIWFVSVVLDTSAVGVSSPASAAVNGRAFKALQGEVLVPLPGRCFSTSETSQGRRS
jgi:hypothetical protein